ncbi:MAG TPA: histidine kinase, partial [Chitinophagaceae bacterium]|nr:histidine kinase [Chitinophagaceae bacterium]
IIFLGFVLLLIISTSKKKQTQLTQAYQTQVATIRHEVQEQTYQAIAMELHDNVGQLLSSSKMMINA